MWRPVLFPEGILKFWDCTVFQRWKRALTFTIKTHSFKILSWGEPSMWPGELPAQLKATSQFGKLTICILAVDSKSKRHWVHWRTHRQSSDFDAEDIGCAFTYSWYLPSGCRWLFLEDLHGVMRSNVSCILRGVVIHLDQNKCLRIGLRGRAPLTTTELPNSDAFSLLWPT